MTTRSGPEPELSAQLRLDDADIRHIEAHGVALAEVADIASKLRQPRRYVELVAAARADEDIVTLDDVEALAVNGARPSELPLKFTPMSGAASRMFAFLQRRLEGIASSADEEKIARFMAGLAGSSPRFAFARSLAGALEERGANLETAVARGDVETIVRTLVGPEGMNFGACPKALIPFHRRRERAVTALEEHMHEARRYAGGVLHATVSPEHRGLFQNALAEIRRQEPELVDVTVTFSIQHPATDTVALDAGSGDLVRDSNGALVFFPAGHGALLRNVDELGRPAFLRNIDNVPVTAAGQALITLYHRAFTALLAEIKGRVTRLVDALDRNAVTAVELEAELGLLRDQRVHLVLDRAAFASASTDEQRRLARQALDRPLKIVGVVRNQGEPGGGPFVIRHLGARTVSIVEKDEIAPEQQPLMKAGEFFNPVDLLVDPTDLQGRPRDLHAYVNQARYFVVEKPFAGRMVRRLERPGLWNGAMDGWNALFVAMPLETFAPVKEVNDLLKPAHQAEENTLS